MKISKTTEINYKHYCNYCGAEAKKDISYSQYDEDITFYCDCVSAQSEMKIEDEYHKAISKLKVMPGIDKIFETLRFKSELEKLRSKYHIAD